MPPQDRNSLNPRFSQAIVRRPANSLGDGLTTAHLGAPDPDQAHWQFALYVQALQQCGLVVTVLDPLEQFPDGHFVEDAAVVVPEVAVISRPGALSRREEARYLAPTLGQYRPTVQIEPPGTLDGGDVLQVGRHFLIGRSDRTNDAGAAQLAAILSRLEYTTTIVPVDAGLHFKSSVNHVGDGRLLLTAEFADRIELADFETLVVPDGEQYACNTLLVNDRLLMPSGYPGTRSLLEKWGRPVHILNTSEFRKMDGGLTCLSIRF